VILTEILEKRNKHMKKPTNIIVIAIAATAIVDGSQYPCLGSIEKTKYSNYYG